MSKEFAQDKIMVMFNIDGQRKYLSPSEGGKFLSEAAKMDQRTRVFCRLLFFTGCRISEALELDSTRLDIDSKRVILRTLKRRARVFRAVPVPSTLMGELMALGETLEGDTRLWPWCRQTAWRRVKRVFSAAGINGPQAVPRGLRHQFGVSTLQANMPLSLTQRLLGHARPETTVVYQHVTGDDERVLLQKWWRHNGEGLD